MTDERKTKADGLTWAAVDGHDGAVLDPADVMFDELLTGKPWDAIADAIGYNFRHTIDIGEGVAFAAWGQTYLVVYSGQPVVLTPPDRRFSLGFSASGGTWNSRNTR